jgi:hypothetical protein
MTFRIGSRTFWFFLTVLGAAVQPAGEPVLGGLPDGVVHVVGLRGDALVELGVQVAELVDDGGSGLAADLAPGALAIAGLAEGDLAAPQAGGVPVASGAAVFERDAVFAATAPGSHGTSQALVGTTSGDDGRTRRGIYGLFRTRITRLGCGSLQVFAGQRMTGCPW